MAEEREFDVVVIGSGAGGGTAARELSALCGQGLKVAVLEAGPEYRDADFTGNELEMAGRLYFGGGGILTQDKTMTLAFARAWGGSTVVYTGTSLPLPLQRWKRWGVPGLDWEDLRRRSAKYLNENNCHLLDESLLNENNRLFRAGCRSLGLRVEQFPVNLKDCRGGGRCNLGCGHGAKQGTHRVQLPQALAAGVERATNCRVERLEGRVIHAVVESPKYGLPSQWRPGRYRIKAGIVVLAAGAVNTPALMLRSGMGSCLPMLGRRFTCQPSMILAALHERPISNYWGHPKSFYCDQFVESDGFLLETCMYFPFTTAKSLPGFGDEHADAMSRMDTLQMILALAIDDARPENRVRLDPHGETVVDYTLDEATLARLGAASGVAAQIFAAAGAGRACWPAGQIPRPGRDTITAAHLMGGCGMGTTAADSVTDAWGRVHGIPWLFVADASLFPSAAGINPYITIMALADRTAQRVRELAPELLAARGAAA